MQRRSHVDDRAVQNWSPVDTVKPTPITVEIMTGGVDQQHLVATTHHGSACESSH
ncbi:hypothetical protein [Tunturiibacter gelidiferens]|uniref:hypothetical protein n=1 Tax=Tunturiibacter gelidiferens TaxID=3069689 RepID=UPI003D9B77E6